MASLEVQVEHGLFIMTQFLLMWLQIHCTMHLSYLCLVVEHVGFNSTFCSIQHG
jgi:hypothetical protein